jgi:hypothetical protein
MIYFTAHTFKCVCHCRRAMFRVLGMYNFDDAPNNLLCNELMNSLHTFLISTSIDSFKLILFFFLVLWLAEIGFTIFCVIWMKNHYAVCAISTGNKNMILGKGTIILG